MPAQKINQLPATLHVEMVIGDYWSIKIVVAGQDLALYTIEAAIQPKRPATPPNAAVPAPIPLTIDPTDLVNGTFVVKLPVSGVDPALGSEDLDPEYHTWYVAWWPTADSTNRTYISGKWIAKERA